MRASRIMETLAPSMDREFADWAVLVDPPPVPEWEFFMEWLSRGYQGTLEYLERTASRRRSLSDGYPGYRSLILGILPYDPRAFSSAPSQGRLEIARYAVGEDYHVRFEKAFGRVLQDISPLLPEEEKPLIKPDHGSLLEKSFAQMAGLGRMGKNTLLIHPGLGSWFTIGSLLLKTPLLEKTVPLSERDPCGPCSRCLDACPTQAFEAPYLLDARQCLSYLTIERPGEDGDGLRKSLGDRWLFGCDRCQEVCPHNKEHPSSDSGNDLSRFLSVDDPTESDMRAFRTVHGALSRVPLRRLLERAEEVSRFRKEASAPEHGEKRSSPI